MLQTFSPSKTTSQGSAALNYLGQICYERKSETTVVYWFSSCRCFLFVITAKIPSVTYSWQWPDAKLKFAQIVDPREKGRCVILSSSLFPCRCCILVEICHRKCLDLFEESDHVIIIQYCLRLSSKCDYTKELYSNPFGRIEGDWLLRWTSGI